MDSLDLTSIRNALGQLEAALAEYGAEPGRTLLRDGLIQRFEFTYTLCDRMMRRYLEVASSGEADVDGMTFPAVVRTAAEQGLLRHGWDVWHGYREARNKTSHTYSELTALEVVETLPGFVEDVRFLVAELGRRAA